MQFLFELLIILNTLLCALVAGLVWCFAVVAMPGIKTLSDHDFLNAFKVMDRVIQNNQPTFMLVWVGSIFTTIATLILGFLVLKGLEQTLLIIACLAYLFGVQFPTIRFNLPLNSKLQSLDLNKMQDSELSDARTEFEPNWNRWNNFRTIISILSVIVLLIVLIRI